MRLLGLAKKAGKLEAGEESVSISARAKKARLILVASDASDHLKRQAENFSDLSGGQYIVLPCQKRDLGAQLGKDTVGIVAITDIGLALSFAQKIEALDPGKCADVVQTLSQKAEKAQRRKKEAQAHEKNVREGKRRTKL